MVGWVPSTCHPPFLAAVPVTATSAGVYEDCSANSLAFDCLLVGFLPFACSITGHLASGPSVSGYLVYYCLVFGHPACRLAGTALDNLHRDSTSPVPSQ